MRLPSAKGQKMQRMCLRKRNPQTKPHIEEWAVADDSCWRPSTHRRALATSTALRYGGVFAGGGWRGCSREQGAQRPTQWALNQVWRKTEMSDGSSTDTERDKLGEAKDFAADAFARGARTSGLGALSIHGRAASAGGADRRYFCRR